MFAITSIFNLFISIRRKETTIFDRRLSFLFVLLAFLFSFFSLLSNFCFQRKDKREEIKEKVAFRMIAFEVARVRIPYAKPPNISFCSPQLTKPPLYLITRRLAVDIALLFQNIKSDFS
ncbi:MAG: hypothetical protein IJD82_05100 [Clostridia bacterium]|nr:hypothetical protein [Clostridia bacterium]